MLTEKDEAFLKALDEVVAERPNRVYGRFEESPICKYHDSKDLPGVGCIIGEALKKVNPDLDLSDYNGTVFNVLPDFGYSNSVTRYARIIQIKQDCGCPWKECWEIAQPSRPN